MHWFLQGMISKFLKNRRLRLNTAFLLLTTVVAIVMAFLYNWIAGLILLVLGIIGLAMSLTQLQHLAGDTEQYLRDLTYEVQNSQQEALLEMPLGIIIMNARGVVRWANPYMVKYLGNEIVVGEKLENSVPELAQIVADHQDDQEPIIITWQGHKFEFRYQKRFHNIYLKDITKYERINQRYLDERLFLGNIYLDNYVELTQGMSDSDVSNLHNYVTSELSDWANQFNLLLKVIDDDNYLLLGHESDLHRLENRKFKILDIIRENTSKMNSPVTLSVGISYGQTDFIKLADTAQRNLDLALGRGGDQVVVRAENEQARFFGGKTNPMEKRTRVRARVISHAFQELMNQSDQLFVVGHSNPDMDSMGACLGIRRIAEMNGQKCWIVLDQERLHSDIARLIYQIKDYQSIEDCIITPAEALDKATSQSLLVMVDHSKVSLSMASDLYQRLADRTVIIDHHRRGEEFPENPLLVYIEPYASSTCELITEMFEYQPREGKALNKLEATAMLTGIEVDTKNFTQNAGTRTFDAASYLRSAGADGLMIQYFMKENVDDFMERNHLIAHTDFVAGQLALCVGADDKIYDPVTAAQAADMLLQVEGVDASFVITRRSNDTVGISARSMGDYNVQIIMEKMGGGGHLANAATQIKDQSVDEVKQQLLDLVQSTAEVENPEE
ncbi:DHH family phosphoesterase [Limosilactobacillus caecicola]|uniref:DHH family phosphoesterase n=1 Tax=Limosilactobacillus caecicola TaxID=2941332 RepID=UPI00203C4D51|nr:DHH family phosphoesterase [Limosilactobacillus caecicola]